MLYCLAYSAFVQKQYYGRLGEILWACTTRMSRLFIRILGNYVSLNVGVMPSMHPFALEQKRAVPRGNLVFSLILQNLVAFWGEIMNAVWVSRTPPSGRIRKFGWKKVCKRSVDVWQNSVVCVAMSMQLSSSVFRGRRRGRRPGDPEQQRKKGVMQNCFHLNRCVINPYVINGESPLCNMAYIWLLMAVVSMIVCAATLRWFRLPEPIPYRHTAGLAKVSFITASWFESGLVHKSCTYAL